MGTFSNIAAGLGAGLTAYGMYRSKREADRYAREMANRPQLPPISGGGGGPDYMGNYDSRAADVRAALARIDSMFSGREKVYDGLSEAAFNRGKMSLDETRDLSAKDLKFNLARAGTSGGSIDVAKHAQLRQAYDQGLIDYREYAEALADQARQQDFALRAMLTSQAMGAGGMPTSFPGYQGLSQSPQAPDVGSRFATVLNKIGAAGSGRRRTINGGYA